MTNAGPIVAAVGASPTWTLLTRAGAFFGDLAALIGLILCVPLAIVVVGAPLALFIRLVMWLTGMQ